MDVGQTPSLSADEAHKRSESAGDVQCEQASRKLLGFSPVEEHDSRGGGSAGRGDDVFSVATKNYKLRAQHFTLAAVVRYVYDTCDHG